MSLKINEVEFFKWLEGKPLGWQIKNRYEKAIRETLAQYNWQVHKIDVQLDALLPTCIEEGEILSRQVLNLPKNQKVFQKMSNILSGSPYGRMIQAYMQEEIPIVRDYVKVKKESASE